MGKTRAGFTVSAAPIYINNDWKINIIDITSLGRRFIHESTSSSTTAAAIASLRQAKRLGSLNFIVNTGGGLMLAVLSRATSWTRSDLRRATRTPVLQSGCGTAQARLDPRQYYFDSCMHG